MNDAAPVGLLIAAGRSRRMGRQKLLLPWPPPNGRSTVVATAFDLLQPHCARMIVVLGDDPALTAALDVPPSDGAAPRSFTAIAGVPDGDMFDSVRAGLEAARGASIVLLQPADHPTVLDSTITLMLDALRRDAADPPIIAAMPEHRGRGGHPVAIRGEAIDAILAWRGDSGLAGFWRDVAPRVRRIPVDDPACRSDLDNPGDYTDAIARPLP